MKACGAGSEKVREPGNTNLSVDQGFLLSSVCFHYWTLLLFSEPAPQAFILIRIDPKTIWKHSAKYGACGLDP